MNFALFKKVYFEKNLLRILDSKFRNSIKLFHLIQIPEKNPEF